MQALFSDYAVQHQPLVEAIHENEPVDDVAENAAAELRRDTRRSEPAVEPELAFSTK
jgi:hypothetical protein